MCQTLIQAVGIQQQTKKIQHLLLWLGSQKKKKNEKKYNMSGESSVIETLTEQDKGIAGDEGGIRKRVLFHKGGEKAPLKKYFERL